MVRLMSISFKTPNMDRYHKNRGRTPLPSSLSLGLPREDQCNALLALAAALSQGESDTVKVFVISVSHLFLNVSVLSFLWPLVHDSTRHKQDPTRHKHDPSLPLHTHDSTHHTHTPKRVLGIPNGSLFLNGRQSIQV